MKIVFFVLVTAVVMTSCNWINPSEETPSYIRVESIPFSTTSIQGTSNQSFVDAWVYIDGEKIGTFQMPCTFPVLLEGSHKVKVFPGIKLNGIASTRSIYPFAQPWEATINLIKDSVTFIHPTSSYYDNLVYASLENFEDAGITLTETSLSDTVMQRVSVSDNPSNVFEGSYSGMLVVDTDHDTIDVRSNSSYVLPNTGAYNFLELNFKTDAPVVVGVISNTSGYSVYHPVLILNETSTWKKIYVNFTPVITREYQAGSFYYYFRMELPDGMTEAHAYIDNIKLIHAE